MFDKIYKCEHSHCYHNQCDLELNNYYPGCIIHTHDLLSSTGIVHEIEKQNAYYRGYCKALEDHKKNFYPIDLEENDIVIKALRLFIKENYIKPNISPDRNVLVAEKILHRLDK